MKKDFNYPTEDVIPHFNGMPCDCVDCVKNAVYTKQLTDRNAGYQNSFDFPDFNDLKISATELLGRATGNPIAISAAQNARAVKNIVKTEVAKVNNGGTTQFKNLPKDGSVPPIDPVKLAPRSDQVSIDWLGWFDWKIKLVLIGVITFIIISTYLRATGK